MQETRHERDPVGYVVDDHVLMAGVRVLRRQWIDRDDDLVLGPRTHDILSPNHHTR